MMTGHNFQISNCDKCKILKKECRGCELKRRHKEEPLEFLKRVWNNIKIRCTNEKHATAKYYYGKEFCDKEDFLNYFVGNKQFLKLYKKWQQSGFQYKEIPSINRFNNKKGYILNNLEFITHSKNCGIDKEKFPILMFDLNGNFIKEFKSKYQAHKELGIPNGNICKVVYGKRKSAGGYIFKLKP